LILPQQILRWPSLDCDCRRTNEYISGPTQVQIAGRRVLRWLWNLLFRGTTLLTTNPTESVSVGGRMIMEGNRRGSLQIAQDGSWLPRRWLLLRYSPGFWQVFLRGSRLKTSFLQYIPLHISTPEQQLGNGLKNGFRGNQDIVLLDIRKP